jgi:undecaprenyl diphosphate synthase
VDNSNIKVPNHLAIIMDGNGRWATEKGYKRSKGHLEGSKTLKKIALYAYEKGVKVLSVFAFSTENFKRSKEEVDYLMNLFVKMFNEEFEIFKSKNIKVVFSGRKDQLSFKVLKSMEKISKLTYNNTGGIFNICLNYGGQDEIIDATKKIGYDLINHNLNIEDIDRDIFKKYLYNDLPDIDLLIRTSGEYRISNFMLWQMAYAELYFPKVYFPAFTTEDLDMAILEYNNRDRRFGEIKYETKNN